MNRQSWRARSREARGGVRGGHGEGISRKPHLSSPQPPPDGGPCWGMAVRGRWAGGSVVGRPRFAAVLPGLEVVTRASEPAAVARGPSPVDEVLVLVALHLVLNGGLQVPDALER